MKVHAQPEQGKVVLGVRRRDGETCAGALWDWDCLTFIDVQDGDDAPEVSP